MEKKLVSIIIPIFKVEQFLRKCVDSVLEQTYDNLEIILVDDGSPDNCPSICDDYSKLDDRVVVIHKENGGLSDARNAGLDISNGDFIFFLDSDDFLSKQTIEVLLNAINVSNADIAICNYDYVNGINDENMNFVSPIKDELLDRRKLISKLIEPQSWFYVVAWNKLYKKEIFNNIRFPVGKLHEDEYIVHRIFYNCTSAIAISAPLYHYLKRADSITTSGFSLKNMGVVEALADRCSFFLEKEVFFPIDKTFSNFHSLYFNRRTKLKKINKMIVKKYDYLYRNIYKSCKRYLSFSSRIMGMFPTIMIVLKRLRLSIKGKTNSID